MPVQKWIMAKCIVEEICVNVGNFNKNEGQNK